MILSRLLLVASLCMIVSQFASCGKLAEIKGSVAGTVYNNGRPLMGQIQLIDPKSGGSIKTEPVNNQGHFIISSVPPGEWVLAFLGPSSAPLGEYKYVKVTPGRPVTDLVFEIRDVDPLVQDLKDRINAKKGAGEEEEKKEE